MSELTPIVGFDEPKTAAGSIVDRVPSRTLRVLVVEDDFSCRVVLQGLLSKYGECHIAVNGHEAVAAFWSARKAGNGYDLICMDIQLPEMNGREAVEQIRSIEQSEKASLPRVKIFMTTGRKDKETILGSFNAICDAYLVKPIDGNKLQDQLKFFGLIA